MQSTAAKLLFCAFLLSLVFGVWGASDTPASLEPEAAKEAGGSPTEPSEPEDEYLKYVGFDTSKEQCQKWWEDREKLLKENPQSKYKAHFDILRQQGYLETQLKHTLGMIEFALRECTKDESGKCDPFEQHRITELQMTTKSIQLQINELREKIRPDIQFHIQKVSGEIGALNKMLKDCEAHLKSNTPVDDQPKLSSVEEVLEYFKKNDPESPEILERIRVEKQRKEEEERTRTHQDAFLEHINRFVAPKLTPEQINKLNVREKHEDL